MRWYQRIIKRILSGVIFLLLPVVLLVFILGKAIGLVKRLMQPIKAYLPDDRVLGMGLLTLASLVIILIICYLAGFLAEGKKVKSLIVKLENNVLDFIPGYALVKSWASEAISETDDEMRAVLVNEAEDWRPGIEVDRQSNGYSSVFFPGPPFAKSGLLKLVHQSKLKTLDIPVGEMVKMVRKYGKGSVDWMNEKNVEEK